MDFHNLTARASIKIRRPPAEVFNAFVDASAMSKFWFTRKDEGLTAGETSTWFIGSGEDAFSFDVRVVELIRPSKLVIEWAHDEGKYSQVTWTFEETQEGETVLMIEESGFTGSGAVIVKQALVSTGGFNQVIIAAKAFIEQGVALNVVADHA